jgi:hypothetical protein
MKYTDIDEVYRLGAYKNSINDKRNELVFNSNDNNSTISSPDHTVVMGDLNEDRENEPVGISMMDENNLMSTASNFLLMGNSSRDNNTKNQEDSGGNLLENILSKINLVLQKVDSNTNKQRSQTEVYVHLMLYFITGLFILYVLFYVFQLGKQEIKITLAK